MHTRRYGKTFFVFLCIVLLMPHAANALEKDGLAATKRRLAYLSRSTAKENARYRTRVPRKIQQMGLIFAKQFDKEAARIPSFELKKYEIRDWDMLRANRRGDVLYQNDLNLEKKALYEAASDLLNSWKLIRNISAKLKRYTRAEVGFGTYETIAPEKKLSPSQVAPEPPSPKVELPVLFGERKKKRVRLGLKFDSASSIADQNFSIRPLAYLKVHLKPIRFQARWSSLEKRTIFEVASNRPIRDIHYIGNYDTKNDQLTVHIFRQFANAETRLNFNTNLRTHETTVILMFFTPIRFH